jgi:hypothetical protein
MPTCTKILTSIPARLVNKNTPKIPVGTDKITARGRI